MTFLTAHPQSTLTRRRLASVAGRFGAVDLLWNRDAYASLDWNWSASIGPFTLAFVAGNSSEVR